MQLDLNYFQESLSRLGYKLIILSKDNFPDLYRDQVVFVAYLSDSLFDTSPALFSATSDVCKVSIWDEVRSFQNLATSGTLLKLLKLNYELPFGRVSATQFESTTASDTGVIFAETMFFWRTLLKNQEAFDFEVTQRLRGLKTLYDRMSILLDPSSVI